MKGEKRKPSRGQSLAVARTAGGTLTPELVEGGEFIRVEKDLISVGFFTPTSKSLKSTRVKTVRFARADSQGRRIETSIRIVTGGDYGLPGTGDLDKWLAFQRHVHEILKREGAVTNPITFTSWELLSALGVHRQSGKNYGSVEEWLDRMCATTIEVKGEGSVGEQKRFGKDRGIQVFERGVTFGRELKPGVVADRNHVWLSEWQLKNLNGGYNIPIDFDAYLSLKNATAKTLLPLLQVWLYGTRGEGVFVKSYDAICELLGITRYAHESKVREKLGPSLDELKALGLLAEWHIERLRGGSGHKLIFKHGAKFYRDMETNRQRQAALPPGNRRSGEDEALVEKLAARGVFKAVAEQLVDGRVPGQDIEGQIEWVDEIIRKRGAKSFDNAPGLYVKLIRANAQIDPNFETSRVRRQREKREQESYEVIQGEYQARRRYEEYVKAEITAYIERLSQERYDELMGQMRVQFNAEFSEAAKIFKEHTIAGILAGMLEKHVAPEINVMSFEEFESR